MNHTDVLRRPIVTEKTDALQAGQNQYVFEVHPLANKREIRDAAKALFGVDVVDVRTMVMPGKPRRWGRHISHTPAWKKAVLTVGPGSEIRLFE